MIKIIMSDDLKELEKKIYFCLKFSASGRAFIIKTIDTNSRLDKSRKKIGNYYKNFNDVLKIYNKIKLCQKK